MTFDYPLAFNAIKFMAIIARMGAFMSAFPIFNSGNIPAKYKVFFVMFIGILLIPVVPSDWVSSEFFRNLDLLKLTFMMVSEILLGLTISIFVLCIIEIFQFGGFIIDRGMGFVMAQIMDPGTGASSTPISNLLVQGFYLMFLISDGHHEVLRLAAYSFQSIPPGSFLLTPNIAETAIALTSQIFVVGLQIAFPVFAAMFFVNLAMGLLARVGEDFPVLMLSFPIRFGLGFIILIGTFPIIISICRKMNQEMLEWIAFLVRFEF